MEDITNKVEAAIARYDMIAYGDRVIVALSGGPDSVCLLHILHRLTHELGISLIVAHFNHGLREDEDELDTKLVKELATSMDIPLEVEKATRNLKGSSSLEEQARNARYAFLEKIRIKHGAHRIAMGHNLNDQAETVIMRLLRGSGMSGLAGIPPVRDGIIIRPLIEIGRDDIMDYLRQRGLPFAIDSSNNSTAHLRNRIRHELMPMLIKYQPNLLERLRVLSNIIRDENAFLESLAVEWVERESEKTDEAPECKPGIITCHYEDSIKHGTDPNKHASACLKPEAPDFNPGIPDFAVMMTHSKSFGMTSLKIKRNISVAVSSIKKLPVPLKNRAIRILGRQVDNNIYPMGYDHLMSVIKLLDNEQPQCSIDIPNGVNVKKVYGNLIFSRGPNIKEKEYSYSIKGPGTYLLETVGQTLLLEEINQSLNVFNTVNPFTAYLDSDKLQYPLIARSFTPGDRFIPLGMTGHKKIKNFFIDLKVPSETRALTPILTSSDKVVWVCGYRIDERFKVTAETKKVIRVTIQPVT